LTTNLIYFKNKKQQEDKYANEIISLGVIGDIAGQAIQNLNNNNLNELSGKRNSNLKNFLAIYEYTNDELLEMEKESINTVERAGDHYYISGNYTNELDKSKMYSLLNIRIIKLYIQKEIVKFMDDNLSNNMNNKKFDNQLKNKLDQITKNVKKYLFDFDYEIRKVDKSGLIYIDLYESFNEPITRISFNIKDITNE